MAARSSSRRRTRFSASTKNASIASDPTRRTSSASSSTRIALTPGCWRRRRSKSLRCTECVSPASSAATVADLGAGSRPTSASSPNASPGTRIATVTLSPTAVLIRTANRPFAIRCSVSAGSPSWKTISPRSKTRRRAILATSGKPVLYRGLRVGRGGRIFTMIKFRTLKGGAEDRLGPFLGPDLVVRTESETTLIGRWLRATQLDETPQLWNVLRGDMSIVGPRPIRPAFFEELCEDLPQYWQRLVVDPGMTGFAQLRMTRETSWAEKLAHDLEYIADRSVALYLRVCAATAWRILTTPVRALSGRRAGPE